MVLAGKEPDADWAWAVIRGLWRAAKRRAFVGQRVAIGERFHMGILSFVSATDKLTLGDDVYVGKFCSIQVNGTIGNGVLIANNVGIVGRRDHDMRKIGVPISRAPWVGDAPSLAADPQNVIDIGDDVWVGFGAVVLSGVVIGRGAIVAAGAVVVADVAPYGIVAGNPARLVGHRFTTTQIDEHEAALAQRARVS